MSSTAHTPTDGPVKKAIVTTETRGDVAPLNPTVDPPANRHESRLARALRELLTDCRVAALGTLGEVGLPSVSMLPYAVEPDHALLVLHVSGLAAHTGNLERQPLASLMVMQPEAPDQPVHALPRITLQVRADTPAAGSALHTACRHAYLARFPEAEPMTALGDFRFVVLHVLGARQVAGFGAARTVDADELRLALHD